MTDEPNPGRYLQDALARVTEHADIAKPEAFREMCQTAIKLYDGTDRQDIADWAREGLRLLNESQDS